MSEEKAYVFRVGDEVEVIGGAGGPGSVMKAKDPQLGERGIVTAVDSGYFKNLHVKGTKGSETNDGFGYYPARFKKVGPIRVGDWVRVVDSSGWSRIPNGAEFQVKYANGDWIGVKEPLPEWVLRRFQWIPGPTQAQTQATPKTLVTPEVLTQVAVECPAAKSALAARYPEVFPKVLTWKDVEIGRRFQFSEDARRNFPSVHVRVLDGFIDPKRTSRTNIAFYDNCRDSEVILR